MATGTVKWFNTDKGYGFIDADEGGDVFVHVTDVEQAGMDFLNMGQRVRFDLGSNPRNDRTKAVNLQVL